MPEHLPSRRWRRSDTMVSAAPFESADSPRDISTLQSEGHLNFVATTASGGREAAIRYRFND